MDNFMRLIADPIRRYLAVFAAILVLFGLPGCGVLQGMLEGEFDDPEKPTLSQSDDDSMYKDAGLSDSARATLKDFDKSPAPAR
jgi:hypothetical protein